MRLRNVLLAVAVVLVGLPAVGLTVVVSWINLLDRTNGTIVVDGVEREYLLHVPAAYDSAGATPLVISLHAGATWPMHQANLTRWNRLADEQGFIVVYPSGTPQLFGVARIWHTTPQSIATDVRFISVLIDTLAARFNIDPARIYANGMSLGGGMAYVLSCGLSDRIAATGLVAAAQSLPVDWCANPRPPLIAFHGDADSLVPYAGGRLGDPFAPVRPVYLPVREWVAGWAGGNGCSADPIESTTAADVRRLEYSGCRDSSDVVLYTLLGGGHSWPGGKAPPKWRVGTTSTGVDATLEMWRFFLEHPLQVTRR